MEPPWLATDPSRSRFSGVATQSLPCRIDELAMSLKANTAIAEPRFSTISVEQLVGAFCSNGGSNMLLIDVREEIEMEGGHIPGAQIVPLSGLAQRIGDLVSAWKSGRHLVVYCSRCLSKAPCAIQQIIRSMDQEHGATQGTEPVPMLSILQGGFVAYLEHVATYYPQSVSSGSTPSYEALQDFVAGFDPNKWVVEEGADRLLRHVSECKEGDEVVEERKAAGIEDAHVSDELAFLVQSACVLAPPAADSMPYIL